MGVTPLPNLIAVASGPMRRRMGVEACSVEVGANVQNLFGNAALSFRHLRIAAARRGRGALSEEVPHFTHMYMARAA